MDKQRKADFRLSHQEGSIMQYVDYSQKRKIVLNCNFKYVNVIIPKIIKQKWQKNLMNSTNQSDHNYLN